MELKACPRPLPHVPYCTKAFRASPSKDPWAAIIIISTLHPRNLSLREVEQFVQGHMLMSVSESRVKPRWVLIQTHAFLENPVLHLWQVLMTPHRLTLTSHALPPRTSWPISYLFLEKDFSSWPDLFLNNFYQIIVALAPGE